jgi:Phage portal protein, SPP1 Gp6-like
MDMTPQALIDAAAKTRSQTTGRVSLARQYYKGEHRIALASKQYTNPFRNVVAGVKDNQVKLVVDTTSAYMRVTGFECQDTPEVADVVEAQWKRSGLSVSQRQAIYRPEQVDGSVVLIAWPDGEGKVRYWAKPADQVIVKESTETPGKVLYACDFYTDDNGRTSCTVYTPQEVRPFSRATGGRWELTGDVQVNPLGAVPVAVLGDAISDVDPIIPLNDLLNKSLMNLVVAGEFYALPTRVALGFDVGDPDPETGEPTAPFKTGPDRVLVVPPTESGEQAPSIFDLPGQNPTPMLAEQESMRTAIARLSQTPAHLLNQTGQMPSGESLKTAMAPFLEKVADKQAYIGAGLARVAGYGYQLEVLLTTGTLPAFPLVDVVWEAPSVGEPSETETATATKTQVEAVALLVTLGVPLAVALAKVMGWDAEDIAQAAEGAAAQEAARLEAQAHALDLGQA